MLVGTAFSAMAAMLLLHGIASPGVIVGSPAALALVAFTLILFGYLILRSLDTYVLTQRRGDAAVVVGLAFLAAALVARARVRDRRPRPRSVPPSSSTSRGPTSRGRSRAASPPSGSWRPRRRFSARASVRLAEKDCSTEEHTRRAALLAVQIGESPGLPPSRLRGLATGGLLHDIGKLAVPDAILKKPGSLTDEEFGVIQRHPDWGHHLLGELGDFAGDVRRLVLDHHERLDGSGYARPDAGSARPETRILAVRDV